MTWHQWHQIACNPGGRIYAPASPARIVDHSTAATRFRTGRLGTDEAERRECKRDERQAKRSERAGISPGRRGACLLFLRGLRLHVFQRHLDDHGLARADWSTLVLDRIGVGRRSSPDPLDDLGKVAGGVIGGQEGELVARGGEKLWTVPVNTLPGIESTVMATGWRSCMCASCVP